jgi:hypothetical protein
MNKRYLFGDELLNEECEKELNEQDCHFKDTEPCLTEQDFYPPSDNRVWKSNIKDVDNGDNFADYCVEFFEMLDEDEYYDN